MKNQIMIILLVLYSMSFAHAGTETGNGGITMVCRNPNKKIRKVTLLDTFEGRERYLYKMVTSKAPIEVQVEKALKLFADANDSFDPEMSKRLTAELKQIESNLKFISKKVILLPTNDAFPVLLEKGCQYEQMANYTSEGTILVDANLYNPLPLTEKAAFRLHEAIYALARSHGGAKSSTDSRQLVAYLFSEAPDNKWIAGFAHKIFRKPSVDFLASIAGSVYKNLYTSTVDDSYYMIVDSYTAATGDMFWHYRHSHHPVNGSKYGPYIFDTFSSASECKVNEQGTVNCDGIKFNGQTSVNIGDTTFVSDR